MKILLVEDHKFLRECLRKVLIQLLSGKDVTVTEAKNGEEAMKMVEKGLRPDIVVTDQDMPRMTGIEFVAWMKNIPELKHIPIILQSIHNIAADKHQANVFITKGNPDGFETALRDLHII